MASKNLVLKDATWNGVESVDFPVSGGGTARYVETSDATAVAADIAQNKTAYVNGSLITGTATPTVPNIQALSVTQNGTYTASGDVDGYSPVTVSVSGGVSNWTLIGSDEFTVSTTSTSNVSVGNVQCTSALWTSSNIIMVIIKDKAGKRPSHFYGSYAYFINTRIINGQEPTDQAAFITRNCIRVSSSGMYELYTGTTGYGVFTYSINGQNDCVYVYARYSSTNSLTIDGTYTVEVYALSMPTGKTIFD